MKKLLSVLLFSFLVFLVACNEANIVKVTLDLTDGSTPQEFTLEVGALFEEPETPIREGYTFIRWYSENESESFDFTKPITENITIYALWEIYESPLKKALAFLHEENNYTLTVAIKDLQMYTDTIVTFEYDGAISKFQDGDYIEYYDRSARKHYGYYPSSEGYVKKEIESSKNQFYYKFTEEMFTYLNDMYILNNNQYGILDSFLSYSEGITMANLSLTLNEEGALNQIVFDAKVDTIKFVVTMTFSNIGEVSIALPA